MNIFGYRITIRKIKSRPHPMDTRAYKRQCDAAAVAAKAALKKEVAKKKRKL